MSHDVPLPMRGNQQGVKPNTPNPFIKQKEGEQKFGATLQSQLRQLRTLTEEAIRAAREAFMCGRLFDAVNWASMSCVEAGLVKTDEGDKRFQVIIEGVSPTASELTTFIYNYLADHGWFEAEVLLRW